MAKIFQFRVLIDHEKDIFRDIEIREDCSFEELHAAIKKYFAFSGSEMASFYLSNSQWDKGQEIALLDMSAEMPGDSSIRVMHKTRLNELIEERGQKLIYVFDFLLMWCFYIELTSILPADKKTAYPRCINKYGTPPDQYSKSPADFMMPGSVEDPSAADDPLDSENMENIDDIDEFGNFENFNLN